MPFLETCMRISHASPLRSTLAATWFLLMLHSHGCAPLPPSHRDAPHCVRHGQRPTGSANFLGPVRSPPVLPAPQRHPKPRISSAKKPSPGVHLGTAPTHLTVAPATSPWGHHLGAHSRDEGQWIEILVLRNRWGRAPSVHSTLEAASPCTPGTAAKETASLL